MGNRYDSKPLDLGSVQQGLVSEQAISSSRAALGPERGDRHYTALFSNTARAHGDWVVIYLDDGASERQATVVTETHGPLAGRRVVRGRERECVAHYAPRPADRRPAEGTGGPA
jgi:hypothetical protein